MTDVDPQRIPPSRIALDEPRMGRRSVEAGTVLAMHVVTLGLTFFTSVLSARIFAPELRGEYGMFMTLVQFVVAFTIFGLPEALVYFHRQGEADRSRVASSIALATALAASVAALAALPLMHLLASRYFPSGGRELVALAFAAGIATVVLRNTTAFLQARHHFLASGLFHGLLPLTFAAALVWVWIEDLDLVATGWLYLGATVLAGAVSFVPLMRWVKPSSLDPAYLWRLMSFSAKSYSQAIVNQLNYRLDIFVVAYLLNDLAGVAYYHIAASLAALVWVVPDSYGLVIYPRMAAYTRERDRSHETVMGLRLVLAFVAPVTLAMALLAPWLVPWLFGAEYETAATLLILLCPGILAMALCKILTRYFVSRNRHQLNTYCILGAVAVDVAANFWLIPRIGISGGAISASIAYVLMATSLMIAFLAIGEVRSTDWRGFPSREIRDSVSALRRLR